MSREDTSGYVWDTALDIISLCASVADVLANPYDPWAWAGLAGDTIDLIPFVTGVGEITKVAKITISATDNTTDVVNATRKLYNSTAKNSGFKTFTGYYKILYESGMTYVGKGGLYRSTVSALNHAATNNDIVKSITWTPAHNKIEAFFYEYILMDKYGGPKNEKLYNSIWSPGKKYFDLLFGGK